MHILQPMVDGIIDEKRLYRLLSCVYNVPQADVLGAI